MQYRVILWKMYRRRRLLPREQWQRLLVEEAASATGARRLAQGLAQVHDREAITVQTPDGVEVEW